MKTMKIILKKTIILTVLVSFNFFSFGQALKVKSNGDVGIGIDPAEKFHINGSIRGNLTAGALKVQTTQGYMTIGPYNSSFAHFFTDLSCFYFSNTIKVNGHFASYYNNNLYLSTDASIRLTILKSNGYVGINDQSPSYRLDVNGVIACDDLHLYSSDERLKKDIKDIDAQTINNLYYLQAKSYIMDKSLKETENEIISEINDTMAIEEFDEIDTTPKIGFVAQQLMEYFPNLVSQDNEGFYSINYISLIPVLVEAVKDHQERIIELEEELEQLKSSNSSLKSESINLITNIEPRLDYSCTLYQNNPNPFNEDTEIKFEISEKVITPTLIIYDMQGTQIRSFNIQDRGLSSVIIYGYELKAGMYMYTLITDGQVIDTKRMILTENK